MGFLGFLKRPNYLRQKAVPHPLLKSHHRFIIEIQRLQKFQPLGALLVTIKIKGKLNVLEKLTLVNVRKLALLQIKDTIGEVQDHRVLIEGETSRDHKDHPKLLEYILHQGRGQRS